MNKEFNNLPKSVKKVIRFIYQDASYDQLALLKRYVDQAIKLRRSELKNRENAK